MKVLIQNAKSGEYLTPSGTWSPLAGHGKDFRFSSCAQAIMRKEKLSGLRVLFYFEEFDYAVRAPRPRNRVFFQDQCATAFDF
jgi:hypothetical protein